jgi:hypothetical protein
VYSLLDLIFAVFTFIGIVFIIISVYENIGSFVWVARKNFNARVSDVKAFSYTLFLLGSLPYAIVKVYSRSDNFEPTPELMLWIDVISWGFFLFSMMLWHSSMLITRKSSKVARAYFILLSAIIFAAVPASHLVMSQTDNIGATAKYSGVVK